MDVPKTIQVNLVNFREKNFKSFQRFQGEFQKFQQLKTVSSTLKKASLEIFGRKSFLRMTTPLWKFPKLQERRNGDLPKTSEIFWEVFRESHGRATRTSRKSSDNVIPEELREIWRYVWRASEKSSKISREDFQDFVGKSREVLERVQFVQFN